MHDDKHNNNNIFADDDALDFMIFKDFEKRDQERNDGKGGCLRIIVLLLLPMAGVVFIL
jgi:hypothetical protein